MTKLLTLLLISASLWAQTPCLNGDGPLQVGQERCLDIYGLLLESFHGYVDSVTVLECINSCGHYLDPPKDGSAVQLNLEIGESYHCAARDEDGMICAFLNISNTNSINEPAWRYGAIWRVDDDGNQWWERYGEIPIEASPLGRLQ